MRICFVVPRLSTPVSENFRGSDLVLEVLGPPSADAHCIHSRLIHTHIAIFISVGSYCVGYVLGTTFFFLHLPVALLAYSSLTHRHTQA